MSRLNILFFFKLFLVTLNSSNIGFFISSTLQKWKEFKRSLNNHCRPCIIDQTQALHCPAELLEGGA